MKLEDAIVAVLKERGASNCKDITEVIQKRKLAKLGGKTPSSTVGAYMIKAPGRFVRVSAGVYELKNTHKPTMNITSQDAERQNADIRPIPYQYTEKFVDISGGGYYHLKINDRIEGIFCRKTALREALEKVFSKRFSKDNFPCVYVLIVNPEDKKVYIGETSEALVRIGMWTKHKEFAYAAILTAERFSSDNIRKNIERVMIESFENIDWTLDNKKRNVCVLGFEEGDFYEELEKTMPIITDRLSCLAMGYASKKKTEVDAVKPRKSWNNAGRKPATWSGSLNRANPPVRSLARSVANDIAETGAVTFESAWLYFCDGEESRKRAFAALAVGKGWLDLVFLAPENATLPKGARRLKPFVLSRKSECRLRIDSSNVRKALELAVSSLEHIRTSDR